MFFFLGGGGGSSVFLGDMFRQSDICMCFHIYILYFVCLRKDLIFSTALKEGKNPQNMNIGHDLPFLSSWGDLFLTLGEQTVPI